MVSLAEAGYALFAFSVLWLLFIGILIARSHRGQRGGAQGIPEVGEESGPEPRGEKGWSLDQVVDAVLRRLRVEPGRASSLTSNGEGPVRTISFELKLPEKVEVTVDARDLLRYVLERQQSESRPAPPTEPEEGEEVEEEKDIRELASSGLFPEE